MSHRIEEKIGSLFEKEYNLFTANGTTAIWLALQALGIKNKKIVMPVNICFVVACAVVLSGNEPYFVDIDDHFSIDPDELKKIKQSGVAAIVVPHMYGNAASIEKVMEVAGRKGWVVIEDVAQSLGAKIKNRYAGSFADISITSFGMGKIIDVNAGGILSMKSKSIHSKAINIYRKLPMINEDKWQAYLRFSQIYSYVMQGIEKGDKPHRLGVALAQTYKDANLGQMAVDHDFVTQLEDKLDHLPQELSVREKNAAFFQKIINHRYVQPIRHASGSTYWRQNIIVKEKRDDLLAYLKQQGVKASVYFSSIDQFFVERKWKSYPKSDLMAQQIINLWPGRQTNEKEIRKIGLLIDRYYSKKAHA